MEKSWRKSAPKGSPRPVFNFDKRTQNSYCIQEILLRIGYFERDYQKAIKNPVSFNGKDLKNKKSLELVTSGSSGYKSSSEKFLY